VPLDGLDLDSADFPVQLAEAFHRAHADLFTYALRDRMPVVVNARVSVAGALPALPNRMAPQAATPPGRRRVFLDGWREVPVFAFTGLAPDATMSGPAIVESDTTTVLLRAGDTAIFDPRGWLNLAVAQA
jgi:N-methylhydantoinase A